MELAGTKQVAPADGPGAWCGLMLCWCCPSGYQSRPTCRPQFGVTEGGVLKDQPLAGQFGVLAAFQAANDLVFKGLLQPSECTEPLLHAWCLKVKAG